MYPTININEDYSFLSLNMYTRRTSAYHRSALQTMINCSGITNYIKSGYVK